MNTETTTSENTSLQTAANQQLQPLAVQDVNQIAVVRPDFVDDGRNQELTAKAEELTRINKAREARERLGRSASSSRERLDRSASSPSLCLTIRLTEMNIKRYVENVIRRSVMEGRSPRCFS